MERTPFPGDLPVSRENVTARVKWYNPTKRFGFVEPTDGSPDAFLHISVVEQAGHSYLPQGTVLICNIAEGPRGPQVANITSIEEMGEDQPPAFRPPRPAPSASVDGLVKFFNAAKGFGFVIPDDGSADVFVSGRVLQRSNITVLEPNQRVRLRVRQGDKGPVAASIEILDDGPAY